MSMHDLPYKLRKRVRWTDEMLRALESVLYPHFVGHLIGIDLSFFVFCAWEQFETKYQILDLHKLSTLISMGTGDPSSPPPLSSNDF